MRRVLCLLLLIGLSSTCRSSLDFELSLTDSPLRPPLYKGSEHVMNCALIGAGRQAARLVDAIQENKGKVIIVYSQTDGRAAELCKTKALKDTQLTTDLAAAIQSSLIDTVVITTPDFLHYEHARLALEAGKHVYLEKPIATTLEQAQALITMARERSLCLMVGYHMRWSLAIDKIRELLKEKRFGTIKEARINWNLEPHTKEGWRLTDNPWWHLSVMGTHCIDLALWLFQETYGPLIKFSGTKNNQLFKQGNEDSMDACLQYEKTKVLVKTSFAKSTPLTIEIDSENGQYTFDHIIGDGQQIILDDYVQKFLYRNPWQAAFKELVSAVADQRLIRMDLNLAAQNVELMELVKKADDWIDVNQAQEVAPEK